MTANFSVSFISCQFPFSTAPYSFPSSRFSLPSSSGSSSLHSQIGSNPYKQNPFQARDQHMDKLLSVHQNKATKQTKPKKKPVKVVYISNPMRVKTSASEFRALVQELTGQDADLPDPSKYPEILDSHQVDPRAMKLTDELKVAGVEPANELPNRPDLPFEHYDDVFMPPMLENFQGLYPASSSLWLDEV
ncbi:hypothetical protein RJ639_001645 [Escallonia herrerae]|uniref:VQ domain-containing protein n=1 Tax=Escallonia herrerae TaxID=1293975 RepID=A0AA88XAY3_9ASTE|nr:hypothetical protein RJ639_001645 [Escallonia herrerae]